MTTHGRLFARVLLASVFIVGAAPELRAESFLSPLVGFNFGGDAGCPSIGDCEDKRLNFGVSLGRLGAVFGFETEFAYAKNFFGESPAVDSSVLTVMGNAMLVPNLGPVRPYATVGLGLIKTHVEFDPDAILSTDNNNFGWNLGGGVFIFFGEHVGVRGDVRYFHSFDDLEILGFEIDDTKLDFGRASGALVLKF
jgi:opacity protein-like surface antigen